MCPPARLEVAGAVGQAGDSLLDPTGMPELPDDPAQTERTRETVLRYHYSWKYRDLDAVMALYHPEVEYHDFFLNRAMGLAELRDYVLSTICLLYTSPSPRDS